MDKIKVKLKVTNKIFFSLVTGNIKDHLLACSKQKQNKTCLRIVQLKGPHKIYIWTKGTQAVKGTAANLCLAVRLTGHYSIAPWLQMALLSVGDAMFHTTPVTKLGLMHLQSSFPRASNFSPPELLGNQHIQAEGCLSLHFCKQTHLLSFDLVWTEH